MKIYMEKVSDGVDYFKSVYEKEEENESSQFIFVESEVDLTNICMVCFKEIGEELGKVYQ